MIILIFILLVTAITIFSPWSLASFSCCCRHAQTWKGWTKRILAQCFYSPFLFFLCWVPEMFCGSVVDPIFAHSFSPAFLHPLLSSLALDGWMTAGPVTEIIWSLFIGALLHWGSLADVAQKLHVMQVGRQVGLSLLRIFLIYGGSFMQGTPWHTCWYGTGCWRRAAGGVQIPRGRPSLHQVCKV